MNTVQIKRRIPVSAVRKPRLKFKPIAVDCPKESQREGAKTAA